MTAQIDFNKISTAEEKRDALVFLWNKVKGKARRIGLAQGAVISGLITKGEYECLLAALSIPEIDWIDDKEVTFNA